MKLIDGFKNLPAKKKVIIISAAVAVIAAVVVLCVFLNKGLYANTMRLLKIEGTVSIEDANGNDRPVIDNVRFNSGEALSTGSDGLASVGLDDTKIVTLESDSRVEFTKSRNMLELNLTQGGLYFEVTEHLEPDETFDIRTSTMTVGIRGTSGYVFYDVGATRASNTLHQILVANMPEPTKKCGYCFHSWRHFYNTYLLSQNISPLKVASVLGHSTGAGSVQENYTNFTEADYKEIYDVQSKLFNDLKFW